MEQLNTTLPDTEKVSSRKINPEKEIVDICGGQNRWYEKMKRACIHFFKQETVLCIAGLLAILSMFIVRPDSAYIDYIDFRTLAILFCLMTIMAGLQRMGIFSWIARRILTTTKSLWQFMAVLVALCFFFSMLITNDVALITFVPLTLSAIAMLKEKEKEQWLLPLVVMQTIAANLGSMLTPIGNPQNLYLYSKSQMSLPAFVQLLLPYTILAGLMLALWIFLYCRKRNVVLTLQLEQEAMEHFSKASLCMYLVLFAASLLVVARVLPYQPVFILVVIAVVLFDRKTLTKVDMNLLFTFIAFFIFIGNMGRISAFQELLQTMLRGHEVTTAIVASQVISNVPAALLLSGFTTDWEALLIGTNLGGLGTLIASMASLISFKYIAAHNPQAKGKYLFQFTIANIVFLAVLCCFKSVL